MLERRQHGRGRVFAFGTVSAASQADGPGRDTAECVVRNASAAGALLLLDEPRRAPAEMVLSTCDGSRPARVVWRGETAVGVAFLAPAPTAAAGLSVTGSARSATLVDLDAVRRRKSPGTDETRLAQRIARFVPSLPASELA